MITIEIPTLNGQPLEIEFKRHIDASTLVTVFQVNSGWLACLERISTYEGASMWINELRAHGDTAQKALDNLTNDPEWEGLAET